MTAYPLRTRRSAVHAFLLRPLWWGLIGVGGASLAVLLTLLAIMIFMVGSSIASAETCIASVYTTAEGIHTASGIRLKDGALTAAHKTLRLRSWARVTNLGNGRSVRVWITDRGPFVRGRCIDLTLASARAIGIHGLGHVRVEPER